MITEKEVMSKLYGGRKRDTAYPNKKGIEQKTKKEPPIIAARVHIRAQENCQLNCSTAHPECQENTESEAYFYTLD